MDVGRQLVAVVLAATRLHAQLSVRPNRHQAVVPDRVPTDERTDRDADSAHLGTGPRAAACLALVPLEQLDSAIDRFAHEGAGDVAALAVLARAAERRFARGCVDAMQRDRIDSQL